MTTTFTQVNILYWFDEPLLWIMERETDLYAAILTGTDTIIYCPVHKMVAQQVENNELPIRQLFDTDTLYTAHWEWIDHDNGTATQIKQVHEDTVAGDLPGEGLFLDYRKKV